MQTTSQEINVGDMVVGAFGRKTGLPYGGIVKAITADTVDILVWDYDGRGEDRLVTGISLELLVPSLQRSVVLEAKWAVDEMQRLHPDNNPANLPNWPAQYLALFMFANALGIAERTGAPLPPRPDLDNLVIGGISDEDLDMLQG